LELIVNDWSHIELTYVVPFYADGSDKTPVIDLLRRYAAYPAEILDVTLFVVVDDGSPVNVEIPSDINLNMRLLRVDEDIAWNQPGARNLGVVMAGSDKLFMTDVDHMLTEASFKEMIRRRNPGRTMYKFQRESDTGEPHKPHPNTYFCSRARFLRFYGTDEQFCGHYGFDDPMFWRWQRYNGTRFLYLPSRCKVLLRSAENAPGFHSLKRDLSHNKELAASKRALWKEYGPKAGHSRTFLNFKWHMIEDRARSGGAPTPKPNRWWIHTWWLRWLLPSCWQ
jgi:hypothetical protein